MFEHPELDKYVDKADIDKADKGYIAGTSIDRSEYVDLGSAVTWKETILHPDDSTVDYVIRDIKRLLRRERGKATFEINYFSLFCVSRWSSFSECEDRVYDLVLDLED